MKLSTHKAAEAATEARKVKASMQDKLQKTSQALHPQEHCQRIHSKLSLASLPSREAHAASTTRAEKPLWTCDTRKPTEEHRPSGSEPDLLATTGNAITKSLRPC